MWVYGNSSLVAGAYCFLGRTLLTYSTVGKKIMFWLNNSEEAQSLGAAHRTEVLSLCRRQLSLIIDLMNSLLWLIEAVI
jgi:hypothetical protein